MKVNLPSSDKEIAILEMPARPGLAINSNLTGLAREKKKKKIELVTIPELLSETHPAVPAKCFQARKPCFHDQV